MDAEILARQTAGYYLTNHNRYHELNGGNPPCKGFGNWLLWYVASVLAPGFSGKVPNSAPGGSFIEGVIWEWMAGEDLALGTQGTKLQKCPEKARLFEDICKLFKPLTDIAYECPKLLSHLKKVGDWKDMQWLCAAYFQQDPSKSKYIVPAQRVPEGMNSRSNPPTPSASQALPEASCSSQSVINPLGSSGLEAPSPAPFQELLWQRTRQKRQINLPPAVIELLQFLLVIQRILLVINLASFCLAMLLESQCLKQIFGTQFRGK